MATVLENYYGYRQQLLQRMAKPPISPADLWFYGEILYRIGVLETCQMYLRSAPITREVPCLQGHYMMLDAYVQNLARERRYGPNRGPDTQKERDAAQVNLERVIQDYRKRFTGFQPAEPEAYQKEIGRVITTLLPAWLQYRNTSGPQKNTKEENRSRPMERRPLFRPSRRSMRWKGSIRRRLQWSMSTSTPRRSDPGFR